MPELDSKKQERGICMQFYDFSLQDGKGQDVALSQFKGKVVLVVNTATGCGFTPHYAAIEKWYEQFHDQGLEVIDVPCNQFYGQAPGTDEEIHNFCQLNYNTRFPQMKKADVNGENELPLYAFLKAQQGFRGFPQNEMGPKMDALLATIDPDYRNNADIKWNFTKFVVNKNGEVAARFEPNAELEEVEACLKKLLAE